MDSDLSLESESDSNRQSNSDRDFDSTTMIQFGTSNRISLVAVLCVELRIRQDDPTTHRNGQYVIDLHADRIK